MLWRYICTPPCSTLMDGNWLLLVPVKTAVDLQLLQEVCSDSTSNKQVKTSICRIKIGGSSANATLFNS